MRERKNVKTKVWEEKIEKEETKNTSNKEEKEQHTEGELREE